MKTPDNPFFALVLGLLIGVAGALIVISLQLAFQILVFGEVT